MEVEGEADKEQPSGEDETAQSSVVAEEMAAANNEFQKRWGWIDLCRKVAEYLHTDFFTVMEKRTAMEVLTITTMMMEDMERKSIKSTTNG